MFSLKWVSYLIVVGGFFLSHPISVPDPFDSTLHPPGQDSVSETADAAPVGGLLQFCGEDSVDHAGGTPTHT